jgi:hypothetical protein
MGNPEGLIIWGLFKSIFFKYLFKNIFPIHSSDVLVPLIGWSPGQLLAASPLNPALTTTYCLWSHVKFLDPHEI